MTRELLKLSDDKEARHRTVTKTATTTTLSRLHPSLREMALQNVVIQKVQPPTPQFSHPPGGRLHPSLREMALQNVVIQKVQPPTPKFAHPGDFETSRTGSMAPSKIILPKSFSEIAVLQR